MVGGLSQAYLSPIQAPTAQHFCICTDLSTVTTSTGILAKGTDDDASVSK